jgi:hypothetical protein
MSYACFMFSGGKEETVNIPQARKVNAIPLQ